MKLIETKWWELNIPDNYKAENTRAGLIISYKGVIHLKIHFGKSLNPLSVTELKNFFPHTYNHISDFNVGSLQGFVVDQKLYYLKDLDKTVFIELLKVNDSVDNIIQSIKGVNK